MSIFGHKQAAPPVYTGIQLQTASNAVPIPIVFGKTLISINVMWYGDFQASATKQKAAKGGLFGGGGGSGYTYTASVALGLCEGPIAAVDQVWKDKALTNLTDLGLSLFLGTTPQTPWSYLTTAFPSQALGYNGVAYVAGVFYSLGSSASLGSHSLEVEGMRYGTGINGIDADPALVMLDILTSAQFGAGFPSASIDMDALIGGSASYQTYCYAMGLALSPSIVAAETAGGIIQRHMDLTNAAPVWSGGLLKFVPYADAPVTGNGYTYDPGFGALYFLTDDDFLDAEDPVAISRSDPLQAYNIWDVECLDRDNAYNLAPIEVFDQDSLEKYGRRPAGSVTGHEICTLDVANISAQLMMQRQIGIRNQYAVKLSWEFCLLDPMDVVAITDSYLVEADTMARVISIDEGDDGLLSMVLEDFIPGVMTALAYTTQTSSGGGFDTGEVAPAVNTPLVFLPPLSLTNNVVQLWLGASGPTAIWGGALVFLSLDNITYAQIGTIEAPIEQGITTADLPAYGGANPDTTSTLSLDLAECRGQLTSVTAAEAEAQVTLSLVGAELLSWQDATLVLGHGYDVTTLYRGLHGTTAAMQSMGAAFSKLDSAIFKYTVPATLIGMTVYLKFQSFNVFGSGLEDFSGCTAYSVVLTGPTSSPPTNLVAVGGAGNIDLTCINPNSSLFQYVQFYVVAHGSPFNANTPVGSVQYGAANATSEVNQSMAAGTYDFYAVAYNNAGVASTPLGPQTATVT